MKFSKNYGIFIVGAVFLGLLVAISWSGHHAQANTKKPSSATTTKFSLIKKAGASNMPITVATGTLLHLPILMYHHIGYVPTGTVDSIRIGLTVSPQEFAQQVSWLKSQGYNSISLNDLYLYTQGKFTLPKKPIIFTFDDGYDDAFTNGIPILQAAGYSGAFGIITNFPGTVDGTNTYAAWQQITAAKSAGMEIVCHTENHFDGGKAKFDASFIYNNLSGCQQALQAHLGSTEPFLIYPYGHFTPTYVAQMKTLGFVMGLAEEGTSWFDSANLYNTPRVRVSPNEPLDKFIQKLDE